MRVDGSIPFHIARAYGVEPPRRIEPATPPAPVTPAPAATSQTSNIDALIGGTVTGPVDFTTATTNTAPANREVLPLYTRAADRIEAAVAIQLGRAIDIRG